MKAYRYIVILFTTLVLVSVLSCSSDFGKNVYYGGISGVVKDKDSGNGVAGVKVSLYTSLSERDEAYSRWLESGGIFSDEKCLYKATTGDNGKWTVSKVIWMAKDGAWGSDYDHIPVYIIYFSEDYGCWKEEEKIELVSGTSNTNAIENKRENIKQSSRLTINFREGNKAINDVITFTYVYNDGYTDIKRNVSTNNGQYVLDFSFVKKEGGTKVTISNIDAPNSCWNTTLLTPSSNAALENGNVVIDVDSASVECEIAIERKSYDLGESGIGGTVTAPRKIVIDESNKSVKNSLDALIVVAKIGEVEDMVVTGSGNYDSEFAGSYSVSFSSLLQNYKIDKLNPTNIEIKVFKKDETDFTSTPLASTTLNLEKSYTNKNSVVLNIDKEEW